MAARPGERIKVQSHSVGAPERWGTILERRKTGFLLVEWDDGHESMFLPGTDVRIVDSDDVPTETHLGCHIEVRLTETQKDCEATATLMTERGTFRASGLARRNPSDPQVPMIGEELSIARALRDLADQIEAAARQAIERHEDNEIHLL